MAFSLRVLNVILVTAVGHWFGGHQESLWIIGRCINGSQSGSIKENASYWFEIPSDLLRLSDEGGKSTD